ncbi:MAG: hypothetical protein WAN16_03630 [Chthoniobacterales bacterium]
MSPDEMILATFCLLFGILFIVCLTAALGWKQEAKEMRDSRDFYKDICDRWKGMHQDSLGEAEKWFGKYIALLKGENK